jgi:signal peptidase II
MSKYSMRNKYYWIALLIVILDHITKWWMSWNLVLHPIEVIPGYLRLSLVHNSGVAFGLFSSDMSQWKPYLLAAMAIVALSAILLYARHMPPDRLLLQWALSITMGGILGNFLDRIFRGYVVDFIEFHVHDSFYFPNFNVADSSITIGIALLLIDTVCNPGIDEIAESTADGQR